MDRPLIELEIVDSIWGLAHALAIVEACARVNLRDCPLHEVRLLLTHEVAAAVAWSVISHGRHTATQS